MAGIRRSVDTHQFAMIPRADIPRSRFRMQKGYKTTFDAGYLVPVMCEEVLPGDTFQVKMSAFARLATPIFPVMDNMHLDSFFFYVPNRLVFANWKRMMGEQTNPGDSISYTIPQVVCPVGGWTIGSVQDYFGLPTVGQMGAGATVSHSSLPLRMYNMIFNEWFRDENLAAARPVAISDGPDPNTDCILVRRGKRHDYFTSCLPFVQKGTAIGIPLGTSALVRTNAGDLITGAQTGIRWRDEAGLLPLGGLAFKGVGAVGKMDESSTAAAAGLNAPLYPTNLYADLSTATTATINALRLAFQTQKLLERDARGGTRYTEIVFSHFGVKSPDARLQRPEYLGGGSVGVNIIPVAQTSATAGGEELGKLAGFGSASVQGHGFSQSFTEHGYIIGLVSVRADLTYQQGLRKHWSRSTRYDFYFPVFAALGEQSVFNREIYVDGSGTDAAVFGYQERWAEYRYNPSEITGLFRSTAAASLDAWHLAQDFTVLPTLNETFIQDTPPIDRVIAVPAEPHFIFDSFFDMLVTRPMPMYSVPGLIDHF